MGVIRRACGVLALAAFVAFQAEAMMPDQCEDDVRVSLSPQDGSPTTPSSDGHIAHACHCLHLHVAAQGRAGMIASPAVSALVSAALNGSYALAPPHLPFRPPLG